ncbi:MAG: type II toxin-antitoxin system VapC family toxin, partial [Verrucomicrobiota bacterium]
MVDAQLVAYLLIPGDKSSLSDAVLKKDSEWATPLLCLSELRNIITLYMRTQGMTLSQAQQTMARAERVLTPYQYAVPSDGILELTAETDLAAYDAEFVALAKALSVPLITHN